MATFSLPGVFSGIDTGVLISATMAAARSSLTRLEIQKATWQDKMVAVADIEARMVTLKAMVAGLDDANGLRAVTTSTSDADIVTISATGGATEGIHDITVNQLASAETKVHAGVTPTETWTHTKTVTGTGGEYLAAADITEGSDDQFVFQFGDEAEVSVDLSGYKDTGISLSDLVTEINTASQLASGYDAAVAEGLGDDKYRLRLQAQNVGDGKGLTITDSNSVDLLDSTSDFAQLVDGDVGADAIIGAGDFVYVYNGETITLTATGADMSLGAWRDRINNDASNPGVTASILRYDGAGADKEYHLVLRGNQTGSDYTLAIDGDTTLTGFADANWELTQTARNSQFRVDGYPSAGWMERSSNTISDAIANTTLTLKGTGESAPSTATVTFTRSTGQLEDDLSNLVAIYNGIVTVLKSYAVYDEETHAVGVLQGDSIVNGMLAKIRSVLTTAVAGFKSGEETFTLASQIGIEVDSKGMMTLRMDSDTSSYTDDQGDEKGWVRMGLSDALTEDYYAVLDLIGAIGKGASDSQFVQFNSAAKMTTAGFYEVKIEFDADHDITGAWFLTEGESQWRAANYDNDTKIISGKQGNPEQFVFLTAIADGDQPGAYDQLATVRVQQGFAGALYDLTEDFLNAVDGAFATKNNEYESAIDRIDVRIDYQERLLEQKEERLLAKYARLEATLARLDSQRGAFEALFTSIEATNNSDKK